jgi:four helix bundle protein
LLSSSRTPRFDHEKLTVYRRSIAFNAWVGSLLENVAGKAAVKDQLDRAATSIPINIAEGNGKFSSSDRARYFDIARGSSVESAACLDVLNARSLIDEKVLADGKDQLVEIVNMLMGLLRRFGYSFDEANRSAVIREEAEIDTFKIEQEQEQEKE